MHARTSKAYFALYNEISLKYPGTELNYSQKAVQARYNFICKVLGASHGTLLDVGCNDYVYEPCWKDSYIGVDIARAYLLKGNRKGVWADAYSLPFRNKCFDCILCSEVIEHLWHKVKLLLEVLRVLKDDGQVIVTVPFTFSQPQPFKEVWMKKLDAYGVTRQPYVHGSFTVKSMTTLAVKSGFKVVERGTVGKPNVHLYVKLMKTVNS